jgi:4-alpha-glucanotransferase
MRDPALDPPAWLDRRAGVILHPTALPGPHGIGDLGAAARAFIDGLAAAGARLWQVLPLVPPDGGGSPYASQSAFAGDARLIDLGELAGLGLLEPAELTPPPDLARGRVDPRGVAWKRERHDRAAARLVEGHGRTGAGGRSLADELAGFRASERAWLADWGLYAALKRRAGGAPWWRWPAPIRDRDPDAVGQARAELAGEVARVEAIELLFDRQARALKAHADARGLLLVGDLPLYVAHDSADVWARRDLFQLDADGRPRAVAGVPPDGFNELGQLWGNPLYDWPRLAADGYGFFAERLRRALAFAHVIRIDHFRGLAAYWEIPAGAEDARPGRWTPGPGEALFAALRGRLGDPLPLLAEDLGYLDDAVRALLAASGLPGMRVLQFAFGGGADNPYLPHRHVPGAVVYTGTHDNDTLLGYWAGATEPVRAHARRYLGLGEDAGARPAAEALVRAAFASVARWAVVPLQDLLGLGAEARFNAPGTLGPHNWSWRVDGEALPEAVRARLAELASLYER